MDRRAVLLPLALLMPVPPVAAEPLRTCEQPANGIVPVNLPWLPGGAKQNFCDQARFHSAHQVTNADDWPEKVTAFRDGALAGIRDKAAGGSAPLLFNASAWLETGFVGSPGELWWGRSGNGHVFTGQESFLRLVKGNAFMVPSEIALRAEHAKRQMEAMKSKQQPPPPPPAAWDAKLLFGKAQAEYRQVGGTTFSFAGGLGGEGDIPPGKIGNAKLTLETSPSLKGRLSFELDVDGVARSFSFPVTHNGSRKDAASWPGPDVKYRIRGAAMVGGELYRCPERPNATRPTYSASCEFKDEPGRETYEAYGAFFGDHAALAAVHVSLVVNSPKRNRHGAIATGIIVLQAADAAPVNVVVK